MLSAVQIEGPCHSMEYGAVLCTYVFTLYGMYRGPPTWQSTVGTEPIFIFTYVHIMGLQHSVTFLQNLGSLGSFAKDKKKSY